MTASAGGREDARARIIEVAAQLLQDHGSAAVTTRRVAETAGVQAPAIYRLFGDKDGLLDAVAEHVLAGFVSAKSAMVQAASTDAVDPLDDLQAGWRMQIDFGVANPTLFGLLSDPDRGPGSPAVRSGQQVLATRVHRIALAGRLRVSEQRAVDLIHAAGTGTVLTILSTPPEHRDPGLADSMYLAVLQQIVTAVPDRAAAGPTSVAVACRALAPRLDMLTDAERRLLTEWLDRAVDSLQGR